MKDFNDLTPDEQAVQLRQIQERLEVWLPEGSRFFIVLDTAPDDAGYVNFISNYEEDQLPPLLRQCAEKIEKGVGWRKG